MWTLILCILPMLVALLPYMIAALKMFAAMRHEQTKATTAATKLETLQELREAKLAKANNDLVLQDIKIETEKLKQRQIMQKLGLDTEPFTPEDYD